MLCAKYIVFLSYVKFFFCKTFIFPRVDTTPCFCGMSCLPPPGKFHAFYWSIKDYGQAGLCREDLWFTTCCLRSNKVNLLDGGLSALTREVVALFDRFKSGVLLTFLSGREFLFGSVSVLVGDEGALKSMYAVKGASGTIPCIFCWNVVQARSTLADHDETGHLQPHTCTDLFKIKCRSDADFANAALLLTTEKARRNKKEFETLEQSLGINFCSEGVLFSPSCHLKPISHTMYDWLHVYLVNGAFQAHFGLVMPHLAEAGFGHVALVAFLKTFTGPKFQSSNMKAAIQTFEKSKSKEAWKPSASEALCVYPLLRIAVMEKRSRMNDGVAHSFLLLCGVLDLLVSIGKDGKVDHSRLGDLIVRHLEAYIAAFGGDEFFPKCHYSIHLPELFRKHGTLISCWTHERKHKQLKMWANNLANAGAWFEESVLREVTQTCFNALSSFSPLSVVLINPQPCKKHLKDTVLEVWGTMDVVSSSGANVNGLTVYSGDVVLLELDGSDCVAEVVLHLQLPNGTVYSIITPWHGLGNNMFKAGDGSRFAETKKLVLP